MTSAHFDQPQGTAFGRGGEDIAAHAIHELLRALQGTGVVQPGVNLERTAADYAAVILRGQVESQRLHLGGRDADGPVAGTLGALAQDLRRIVQQVRAYYLALADLEVRRMLDEALMGPSQPSNAASEAAQRDTAGDTPAPLPRAVPEETESTTEAHNEPAGPDTEAAAPAEGDSDDIYQGTVRLIVRAGGNMQQVIKFVDELCQKPQFRMLRMSGSPQQDGAEIAIGLREPLRFKEVLSEMDVVLRVEDGTAVDGGERTLTVHLDAWAA